jgi:hypothetical protein
MNNERRRWHRSVGTQLPQTAREVANARNTNETDNTLRDFGKCAVALREVLYQDRPLDENEFLFLITISKS